MNRPLMPAFRTDAQDKAPSPGEVPRVVEHLFRHEWGRMVAALTRIFGFEHLDLAEDVVQEALARALQTWPYGGVPERPGAWLMQVARNRALDVVRRDRTFRDKEAAILQWDTQRRGEAQPPRADAEPDEFEDDRLLMMFGCCHPRLAPEMQTALALKTLCGFGTGEIARALLTSESAVAKRLTRAKRTLREGRVTFELPRGEELPERLDGVLRALYLLFNEGYKASGGERLIREELCHEAIRLGGLLSAHRAGNYPQTHALMALMYLNGSRLAARVDGAGNMVLLKHQDRRRWDRAMIARGMWHFARSASGESLSAFHMQAAISACHCAATDDASTDWPRILELYDQLAELDRSPVVALNRAVAVANVHGARAGLEALEPVRGRKELRDYHLLYAVLGELESRLERGEAAAAHFRRSRDLARTGTERRFLDQRAREVEV